jgi:hypothetical protein
VSTATELDTIIDGLLLPEKMISPKYFYDERGSQLFDQITHLPEYYPTETELRIMQDNMDEIVTLYRIWQWFKPQDARSSWQPEGPGSIRTGGYFGRTPSRIQ